MANTFKFSTFLWIVVGVLFPLWPISLPICWYMAYRSYKDSQAGTINIADLQSAAELNKSGVLSDEEFQKIKAKTLGVTP